MSKGTEMYSPDEIEREDLSASELRDAAAFPLCSDEERARLNEEARKSMSGKGQRSATRDAVERRPGSR